MYQSKKYIGYLQWIFCKLAMLTVVHIFKIHFSNQSELQLDVLLKHVKQDYL